MLANCNIFLQSRTDTAVQNTFELLPLVTKGLRLSVSYTVLLNSRRRRRLRRMMEPLGPQKSGKCRDAQTHYAKTLPPNDCPRNVHTVTLPQGCLRPTKYNGTRSLQRGQKQGHRPG